jgi:hypothetical protein
MPLAAGREGGEGGSPESEDLPPAWHSEPLAEGGFVRRRLLTLAALVTLSTVAASSALAASVTVRVEGRTQAIFGSQEKRFEGGSNALQALDAASLRGEFYYHVASTGFGPYVDQIGRYAAGGSNGWAFKVNGASPPVGADKVQLRPGDRVLWYWATFGPTGGPPTLLLTRKGRNCYRVVSENDAGKDSVASGAVLNVDGRRARTRAGRACIGPHKGLVRATMTGAVRSNALR